MALIKCKDCGIDVSTDAKKCPKCGAKVRKPVGVLGYILIGLILILIIGGLMSANNTTKTEAPAPKPSPTDVAALQKKREKMINEVMKTGVIQKITDQGNGLVDIWIRPAFYVQDFSTKETFVRLVYTFYTTQNGKTYITLYDSKSGREVGQYDQLQDRLVMN